MHGPLQISEIEDDDARLDALSTSLVRKVLPHRRVGVDDLLSHGHVDFQRLRDFAKVDYPFDRARLGVGLDQ